jgi:uncharacterized small protein (DUF1192 family)
MDGICSGCKDCKIIVRSYLALVNRPRENAAERGIMSMDDLDGLTVKLPDPIKLETMGIEELENRISELEDEIARIREVIDSKKAVRGDAESLFKK